MRRFAIDRSFALATIPFRPFQHLLTVDDQLSCLASIRHHLVDGGRLILDVFNPSLDLLVNFRFRFEVEHLLARAGFAVEHLYAGYDRSAYGSTYPGELGFVARKLPD